MSFLKSFLASCLGTLVALGVLLFLGISIIASISAEKAVAVSDDSVLHLRLEAPMTELEIDDPLAELFPSATDQSLGLLRLKEVIRYATTDSKIKGIYLNTRFLMTGTASLQ